MFLFYVSQLKMLTDTNPGMTHKTWDDLNGDNWL